MPQTSTLSKFVFGDMTVEYLVEELSRQVCLRMYPSALEARLAVHRDKVQQGWMSLPA
jgi:hypothetical protein